MEFLTELWLPILLSGVFVFVVSSVLHMFIPIHKGDFKKLPGEAEVLEVMRAQGVKRGAFMFPFSPSMKDCGSPEMMAKYEKGPVGFMTVLDSGAPKMGKSLVLWFLFALLISFFTAYLSWLALSPGADYRAVFRVAGTLAILAYAVPELQESIWKGRSWITTFKFVFDGVIYGLVTAGTFGWLWPDVA